MADKRDLDFTYSTIDRIFLQTIVFGPNKICFEREAFDHFRMVFEKR